MRQALEFPTSQKIVFKNKSFMLLVGGWRVVENSSAFPVCFLQPRTELKVSIHDFFSVIKTLCVAATLPLRTQSYSCLCGFYRIQVKSSLETCNWIPGTRKG